MSKKTKDYSNAWRAKNAAKLSAQAKERYAKRTPEEKAAFNAYQIAWRKANPEKQKAQKARAAARLRAKRANPEHRDRLRAADRRRSARRYGMSEGEKLELLELQGNACALCRGTKPGHRYGWHIDHDHGTGVVRGILCAPCNHTLGRLGDTAAAIVRWTIVALAYLKHPTKYRVKNASSTRAKK